MQDRGIQDRARRTVLKTLGVGASLFAIGTGQASAATTDPGKGGNGGGDQNQGSESGQAGGQSTSAQRRQRAAQRRREAMRETLQRRPVFEQPTNEDDSVYGSGVNYFASYSKGLPHDDNGEPDAAAYETLRSALTAEDGGNFDAIPQAGDRPLTNPEAAISYNTVGLDPNDVYAPAAPSFDSARAAGEMVELYWMALLRDVPFYAYADHDDVAAAAGELAELSDFGGPTDTGDVFRGSIRGTKEGPYVSQFLYKDFERGVVQRDQRFRPLEPTDYMIDYDDWLAVQNGNIPDGGINRTTPGEPSLSDAGIREGIKRYPITGRDLATYVGENVSQQPYMNAALILQNTEPDDDSPGNLALGNLSADGPGSVPMEPSLPVDPNVPDGFVDFVRSGYQSLLGGILQTHAHAAWYHKWRVNRRLRPEEFGGRVYHVEEETEIDGQPAAERYPIHDDLLDATALRETQDRIDTALLPQAYPDGSPTHPSYPGGHAVTAGSNATILKAYFDGDAEITNPVRPDPDDPTALTTDSTPDSLTVRGEINKLATNVSYARSWAGIHYRSDTTAGLRVGERIAAAVLRERLQQRPADAYGSRGEFRFRTFDGTDVTVSADGVSPASAFDPPLFRS